MTGFIALISVAFIVVMASGHPQEDSLKRVERYIRDGHGNSGHSGYPRNQEGLGGNYNQGGHNNQGSYPQNGYNQGGYPQGTHNQGGNYQGGYPQNGHNQGGYPQGGQHHGGYPQGHQQGHGHNHGYQTHGY